MIADLFDLFTSNLGVGDITDIVLFLLLTAGIIWFAEDFRKGVIVNFVIFMAVFIWFALVGLSVEKILMTALSLMILIALSIYLTYAKKQGGAYV